MNLQKLAFSKSINVRSSLNDSFNDGEAYKLAGFFHEGKFAWTAYDSILRVISTENGSEVAYYNFAKHHGSRGCTICCVEEIQHLHGTCILAVGIEFTNGVGGMGMMSIFSVQGSKILGSMDMSERITCLKYIDRQLARRILTKYSGIVAVGTEQGKLFFVDLMLPKNVKEILRAPSYDSEIFPMYNVKVDESTEQINAHHKRARERVDKCFFTLQLKDALDDSGSILSILPMPNAFLMSVGLDDGRMILFDFVDLEAFHLAYPPGNRAPLTHMSYIEPIDDPRAVVYVWAFHASKEGPIAVLHSIVFDSIKDGIYEDFKSCCVRLTIPIAVKDTFPIACTSISKPVKPDDDDMLKICLLSWTCPQKIKSYVMVFDLNQWYKAQLPSWGDWRTQLKYAVVFEIPQIAMDINCDQNMLTAFDSVDRPEEHFLPTSLSFNVTFLESNQFTFYQWCGIQMQALQKFKTVGPQMILSPSLYFDEMLQASISPQFYDNFAFTMNTPIELKREFLLSVALEYNYVTFLKSCALAWNDGSMVGDEVMSGVSLSTLTDWIWNRVRVIKESSNQLSKPLFDYSSQRIDCGTQKQLSSCFRQLKILSDLFQTVMIEYKNVIPKDIHQRLEKQAVTIRMAAEYQEVLQWLLNVGLLPEGHYNINKEQKDDDFMIVPYPYRAISSTYESQRAKLSEDFADYERKDQPTKYLFIDAFIQFECADGNFEEIWDCCYPPKSIQSVLRTLLVENVSLENKCVILIYLFMDITLALQDTPFSVIVKNLNKFPTVFKINSAIIKRTQAYWNLDNGNLNVAVDEIISPLANDRYLSRWKRELLLCVLLKQNANTIALKALRCPGVPILPALEVATLLANDLVSEALLVQRRSGDRELLVKFFDKVINSSSYGQLLDLTLTNEEGLVLREYLEKTDLSNCVNLHFVYLLQRSKFTDATELMDRINHNDSNLNLEPPKQVLSAYYTTMDSTTRKLTSMTNNDMKGSDFPSPLSNNLIRSRCNASNDIYQRCIQSINHAIFDTNGLNKEMPFIGSPKLGIFEYRQATIPQAQEVNYPEDVNDNGKRKLTNERSFLNITKEGPNAKKRKVIESQKYDSYVDRRIQTLTRFRNANPRMPNRLRSLTPRTPQRTAQIDIHNFLATPVVKERTPPRQYSQDRGPGTPQSILKNTRSNRGSVSPTRSEFDDNKSVKSITFAMPSTRESSIVDSSFLDESFETKIPEGPKARKSISPKTEQPSYIHGDILHSTSESDDSEDSEPQDKSIYNYVRKSVLPDNFEDMNNSDSSESEIASDEQFEEEELPEHSDDDLSESNEYGDDINIDSSDSSSSVVMQNEVIEIDDSDDEVVETKLPSMKEIQINLSDENPIEVDGDYCEMETAEVVEVGQEEMINILYEDVIEDPVTLNENIENIIEDPVEGNEEDPAEALNQNIQEDPVTLDQNFEENVQTLGVDPVENIEEDQTEALNQNIEDPVDTLNQNIENVNEDPVENIDQDPAEALNQNIEENADNFEADPVETLNPVETENLEIESDTIGILDQNIKENALTLESDPVENIELDPAETLNQNIEESVLTLETEENQNIEENQDIKSGPDNSNIQEIKSDPASEINQNIESNPIEESQLEDTATNQLDQTLDSQQIEIDLDPQLETQEILIKVSEHQEEEIESPTYEEITPDASENDLNQAQFELLPLEEDEEKVCENVEENSSKNQEKADEALKTDPQPEKSLSNDTNELTAPSEDCSFVSAVGEPQNEASGSNQGYVEFVYEGDKSTIEIKSLPQKPNNDEDREIQEILKNALDSDTEAPQDLSTKSKRSKRALSVPLSNLSSPRSNSRSSRASSELRKDPKAILKEKILERIDEQPDGVLTRQKSQRILTRETTPVTPTRSRAPSEEVDSGMKLRRRSLTKTPSTPQRMVTRAISKDNLTEKTPEDPKPPQTRRGRKKTEEPLDQSTSSQSPEDLLNARRLTRSQLAILEKSMDMSQSMQMRATRSESQKREDDSDNESMRSEAGSSIASSRAGRKRKTVRKFDDDETSSVGSRKSKSPVKKSQLAAIDEEENDDARSEKSARSNKSRTRKARK